MSAMKIGAAANGPPAYTSVVGELSTSIPFETRTLLATEPPDAIAIQPMLSVPTLGGWSASSTCMLTEKPVEATDALRVRIGAELLPEETWENTTGVALKEEPKLTAELAASVAFTNPASTRRPLGRVCEPLATAIQAMPSDSKRNPSR